MTRPDRSRPIVGRRSYYGSMDWASRNNKHQVIHNGQVWYLLPAPKGSRWPWVLSTVPAVTPAEPSGYGRPAVNRTEIGALHLSDAKRAAERWLDMAKFCT